MVLLSSCGFADKIFNMFVSLFLAAHLIHLSTADVQCLHCNDVLHPTECYTFRKCLPTERCFVEAFLTSTGDITYDLGCREIAQCDGSKPVTRRHIPEDINRQMSLDMFGNPSINGSKRSANSAVLCSNCCETKLCNSIGCGSDADVQCLHCNDVLHPTECYTFRKCLPTERCFVEAFLTSTGDITYDLGCREIAQCDGSKPVTRRHIPEDINRQMSLDMFGNPSINGSKRSANSAVLCSNCCETKLCNSIGCGSDGYKNIRGPVCADCLNTDSVDSCKTLRVCGQHEVCMLLKTIDSRTHQPKYQTKCEQEQVCNNQYIEYSNIYAMFMVQKLDAISNVGRCSIRCCTTDLCNTQCNSPNNLASPAVKSQPVQSLPKPLHVAAGMPNVPKVHAAEFVAQPGLQNTHFPKGHNWNSGHAVVTESSPHFGSHQHREVYVPNKPDPHGMPIYSVSSESPGMLAALGISELPGPMNTSGIVHLKQNTEAPSRWGSSVNAPPAAQSIDRHLRGRSETAKSNNASHTSYQVFESQGITNAPRHFDSNTHSGIQSNYVQQGNQESLGITMTSAQNIERALNSGIQRVYDSGAVNKSPLDRITNHHREAQRHMDSQHHIGPQGHRENKPINSGPNYTPDQQLNAEAQFLSQPEQQSAHTSNTAQSKPNSNPARDATRNSGTNRKQVDPHSSFDQNTSLNREIVNSQRSYDQHAANLAPTNPNNMNSHKSYDQHAQNSASTNHNAMNSHTSYDQHAPNSAPTNHNAMNSHTSYDQHAANSVPTNHNVMNSKKPYDQHAPISAPTNPNVMNSKKPYDQHAPISAPTNHNVMNSKKPYDQHATNSAPNNPNVLNSQKPYDQHAPNSAPNNPNVLNSQKPYDQHAPISAPTNHNVMNSKKPYDQHAPNSAPTNPNVLNSQTPYAQHAPNSAPTNPGIMNPRSRYNTKQQTANVHSNIVSNKSSISSAHNPEANYASEPQTDSLRARDSRGQNRIPKQHINSNIDFLNEAQRKRVAQVMTSNQKADTHGNFDLLTDAQRKRVAQVMNLNRQADTHASITTNQRSGGSGFDASRNVDNYPNSQAQSEHSPSTTQRNSNANHMQHRSPISQPGSSQGANKKPQMRNTPQRNLDMYQRNAERNVKASPANALAGGSNRINHGSISKTNELHTNRGMHDKPGLLNANENAFTARNSESPWMQRKNVNLRDGKNYQNIIPRNLDPRGQLNSRQNMIESTQRNANQNGPSASLNAKALASLMSQRLAVESMRKSNNNPGQQHQTNSRNKQNVPYIPAAPSYIESTSQANMQQMADPRSIVGSARVVRAPGGMNLPELLHPSRNQPPQGIMNVQRITEAPTFDAFNAPFQSYPQQTLDRPRPMESGSFGPAMNLDVNRGHNVEQIYPATGSPPLSMFGNFGSDVLTTPTYVYVPPTTTVHPCLHNPCVRGTCLEKFGSYKCKCEPGSWGKDCEQSVLVTSPPNITVTTKTYKLPKTTPGIDPCFSNPCMRGKCAFYHKTYRCACDYGFYGRDCEKVSLGGASFLGALGLNIDACQAQAQPCVNGNCTTANNKVACSCEPGYTGTTCSEVLDHCSSLPCVRGSCVNGTYGFECVCPLGFNGIHCEAIDYCATTPCRHGTCSNTANGYVCNCAPGYTGTQCEVVDHCSSSPCVRGRCANRQNEFSCSCPAGYIGKQCEAVDFCFPSPCVHGNCINSNTGYICSCPKGFIGAQCQVIDHCASRPCIRGSCENSDTAYMCICPLGYIGNQCQTVDYCASKPCAHGRCINADADYQCQCPYAYTGKQCQTVNHCSSSPCARGTCKNSNSGYTCDCPVGYTGPQCLTIDHCHSTPCARGTCLNSNTGYTCILSSGYIGSHLRGNNAAVDHCASSPCVHGTCVSSNTGFVCHCPNGYFGVQCEIFVPAQLSSAPPRLAEYHYTPPQKIAALHPKAPDHCSPSPCFRGTCVNTGVDFRCFCPPGFSGVLCEITDNCASSPCVRGKCVSSELGFQCNCPPGFVGSMCEAADHCATYPCVQGTCVSTHLGFQCNCPIGVTGTLCDVADPCAAAPCIRGQCVRTNIGYQCNCPMGYTGLNCEVADPCATAPCLRGQCVNTNTGYQCNCPVGYTGLNCEMADPCAAAPCIRGQCVSTNTGYQCNCPVGYTGLNCEVADPCAAAPCIRGQCVNTNTGYQCICPMGYTGLNCEILDHCASMPCNNGTCVSSDVGFQCNCPPGFAGMLCDITDHCSPPPCLRGKCASTGVGFKCSCQPGFTGLLCDKPDKCASSPCRRGTCASTDLGFICTCPAGFTGIHCETTDHCASFPCVRGDCINTDVGFKCTCPQAYSGVHCEFQDHCASFPCVRGSCNNTKVGFLCTCPTGYTGAQCEVELFRLTNYCASHPCVRGACVNGDVDFLCSCPPGVTGKYCEINLLSAPDHCASYPCVRGTCVSSVVGFLCTCPPRFTGVHCEVDAATHDHCASMPCMQGTCVSSAVGYQCNCPPGFSGLRCDVEDMCANNLCTFGTCVASVTSYTCECFVGFSGMNCDIPGGKYCERNHGVYALCGHGTCASVGSGYECICDPRYNGTHCLFQYECFGGHVCFHDGTCVNNRSCACRTGYTGNHCGTITSYEKLQLKPGDIVTRGKDWSYGNQDGGLHSVGKVISINGMWVNVMWVNGDKYHYTMSYGKYDLELAP